jgi:FlaA1/EpsC-like NDP-sugar epimerase
VHPNRRRTHAGIEALRESVQPVRTRHRKESRRAGWKREFGMQYFVTGATGFIGKRLVKALLQRRHATVHFLLRPESEDKVPALREYWGVGADRAIPVYGDLTA